MKKISSIALMMGIALTGTVGFTACSSSNVDDLNPNVVIDENGQASVRPEFVISIPRSVVHSTRMSASLTQADATMQNFQGLDNIHLIPFAEVPGASSKKNGDIIRLSNIPKQNGLSSTPNINYKVYADQVVPLNTSNFLFYGKSIHKSAESAITTMEDKFKYGILNATGLSENTFTTPGDIVFSLEPINSSTDYQQNNTAGKNIVALLNRIANTTVSGVADPHNSWSTTTDATLQKLYNSFLQISVSSSKSVAIILSRLYFSLEHIQSTNPAIELAKKLKSQILEACDDAPVTGQPVSLKSEYTNYPGEIGLPDGAARVKWNADGEQPNGFVDITGNYGKGNLIDITKYVYPPALWYYVNTPLKASDEKESPEYATAGNWSGVIDYVYSGAASKVSESTLSVALVNPVQYGVGRIETTLKMGAGPFYDRNGDVIETGKYTLTGVLIGGQPSSKYDFTVKNSDNLTIYDKNMSGDIAVKANSTTEETPNQTLALETKKDQKIYVALELVNGGADFVGADGIIPAGGTFYMTAELDPTTASNYQEDVLDKIVIQDHVTQLMVTIKNGKSKDDPDFDPNNPGGLGDGTNGIPDLTTPGIEVGTSVDLNWKQGLIIDAGI
jgi:hypothetical protein